MRILAKGSNFRESEGQRSLQPVAGNNLELETNLLTPVTWFGGCNPEP